MFALLHGNVELQNVYVPAGGDIPDPTLNDKFDYKLKFLRAMTRWGQARQETGARRILVGDLNIAPLETDVWSHQQLLKSVSHSPVEIALLEEFRKSGPWRDAVRQIIPPMNRFTVGGLPLKGLVCRRYGRRLDHVWVTEPLAKAIMETNVFREARGWHKSSDHAPVTVTLKI